MNASYTLTIDCTRLRHGDMPSVVTFAAATPYQAFILAKQHGWLLMTKDGIRHRICPDCHAFEQQVRTELAACSVQVSTPMPVRPATTNSPFQAMRSRRGIAVYGNRSAILSDSFVDSFSDTLR